MSIRRILVALTATVAVSAAFASSASAQTNQQGLVNVAVEDVTVQVPISVAANICDLNVAVLAEVEDDAAACDATAESLASQGGGGGGAGASAQALDPIQIVPNIGLRLLDNDTTTDTGIPVL